MSAWSNRWTLWKLFSAAGRRQNTYPPDISLVHAQRLRDLPSWAAAQLFVRPAKRFCTSRKFWTYGRRRKSARAFLQPLRLICRAPSAEAARTRPRPRKPAKNRPPSKPRRRDIVAPKCARPRRGGDLGLGSLFFAGSENGLLIHRTASPTQIKLRGWL